MRRPAPATIGFGVLSIGFAALAVAYVAYALDPLNHNGGAFGIAVALILFGVPAVVLGWLARASSRR